MTNDELKKLEAALVMPNSACSARNIFTSVREAGDEKRLKA
ncbi:MAG: hypothetical protein WBH66_10255 [Rectinemataceae bacterium]